MHHARRVRQAELDPAGPAHAAVFVRDLTERITERGVVPAWSKPRPLEGPAEPPAWVWPVLDAWRMLEAGRGWPVGGGWAEQSLWFIDALRVFEGELASLEHAADLADADWRKRRTAAQKK